MAQIKNGGNDFVKGADVGFLAGQEKRGVKFHDRNGNERECMELLKNDYQISAIRLRVWVNPRGGSCGKEEVLAMALRAKALGMDVMIDFHYSDSWADPGKQPIPNAWKGHDYEQMKKDLRNHTIDVLTLLKNNGVTPRWVQVGNETTNGLLWDMGHIEKNPKQYAGFIRTGYDAVKEVFPEAIVIVHLDRGHRPDLYDHNLGIILKYGGKFDMVGMSLYPYWAMEGHPELQADQIITDCIANIRHVSEKFGCDVMIVETGYEVNEKRPEIMEEGRRQLARVIREARNETNGRCRGVFYWEPQCLPGGYKLGAFDSKGTPTAIMDGFIEKVGMNQQRIELINNVPYREGESKSWVLDIANPLNYGELELRPAIVIIHGGGWSAGSKTDNVFRDLLIDYAQQGYVTLSIEYRLNQEAPFPACINDVKCAIRWLKAHAKELRVDPERIGVYGHSAGAHLSMMIACSSDNKELEGDGPWQEYSSRVTCVAAGSPPTEIGHPGSPWAKHPEWWPIGYFTPNASPMLLLQGYEDPIVKANLTDDYVEKMLKAGGNVQYVKVHGDHGIAYSSALEITKPAMDAFFARHLKNEHSAATLRQLKVVDGGGSGKFTAVAVEELSLPNYVVYRPAMMAQATRRGGKLPVVVFANGGCNDTSITHERVLSDIASYGYIVIAIGSMQWDLKDRKINHTPDGKLLTDAIDWIIAQNSNPNSAYYQQVDTEKIALGGQSCGGAQLLTVANDSRVRTYVMFNTGMGDMEMAGASKKSLKSYHAPVLYIIGDTDDIAYANAEKDYKRIKHVPVAFANLTHGGHMGTFAEEFGGSFSKMALKWLDWQLKGKTENATIYQQSQLADFPNWTMKAKNFK